MTTLEQLRQRIETLSLDEQAIVLDWLEDFIKKNHHPPQPKDSTEAQAIQYRTQAFKHLLQKIPSPVGDRDVDELKWEALKEKYDL